MTPGSATDENDPEQQFRALYDGNFAAVLGYILRRVEQPADAADVVSEVFLVAWRRLDEAPPATDDRGCSGSPGTPSPTTTAASVVAKGWVAGCATCWLATSYPTRRPESPSGTGSDGSR